MCFHIRVIERLVSFILHGEKSEALARSNAAPDGAMVLLHDVVQVCHQPAGTAMALGVSAGEVMWLVLRQSLRMSLVGVGLGVASAE